MPPILALIISEILFMRITESPVNEESVQREITPITSSSTTTGIVIISLGLNFPLTAENE